MTIQISEVFPKLTPRQRQVCMLLMEGYSNKRIGQVLSISDRTVEDHRREIMKATETASLPEIAMKLCGSPELVA